MDIHNIDLNIGETQRTNCPHCGGYNTFTITNDDGNLIWNCYKLSCNVRGKKKTILSSEDLVALFNKKDKDVCEFVLPSCIVPGENRQGVIDFVNTWEDVVNYDYPNRLISPNQYLFFSLVLFLFVLIRFSSPLLLRISDSS